MEDLLVTRFQRKRINPNDISSWEIEEQESQSLLKGRILYLKGSYLSAVSFQREFQNRFAYLRGLEKQSSLLGAVKDDPSSLLRPFRIVK